MLWRREEEIEAENHEQKTARTNQITTKTNFPNNSANSKSSISSRGEKKYPKSWKNWAEKKKIKKDEVEESTNESDADCDEINSKKLEIENELTERIGEKWWFQIRESTLSQKKVKNPRN